MEFYKVYIEKDGYRKIIGIITLLIYMYGIKLSSLYLTPSIKDSHFFLISLYWTIFMLLLILSKDNFLTHFFNGTFLHYCGKFSFGIYLFHMGFIGYFYANYNDKVKLKFEIVLYSFIGSFFVGALFYYLIERPLMKFAKKICYFISS